MTDEKTILQVLAEQQAEIKSYEPQKWVTRKEESLFEFDTTMAQVVIGVRRSGKSTLCHKVLLERGVRYAYVNLDDDRLAKMTVEDLNTMLSCIYQLYGTDIPYLVLDEIQDVDGWYLFVNRLLRTNLHIFVTGSNAKLLSGELATHLTGRYNEIHLYPFSFSEYCQYHKIDTRSITTKADADRKRAFMDYIHDGGFPEMQGLRNKRAYVQSLIEAILRKDIQKRFKIRNVETLRKLAHHLINNACQEINYDDLSDMLGIADKTTKKYVDYLNQAFLIQLLTRHSFKSQVRIRNQKAYIVDTGLQGNRDNALAPENIGWRLENVVYTELLRRCAHDVLDIYYYKPSSRAKEIDFVVCDQSKAVELIQVAYEIDSERAYNREISSLVKASDTLSCNNLTLIAFSSTRNVETEGKTIHIVSALEWLLKND
ncbi:MAG: ATP-binding protein [Bacteroidales bacterium]|jgi:predicted AAA+ superfamily ATPase|nr:ATP-binding protein [Bacteroidales bacterium]